MNQSLPKQCVAEFIGRFALIFVGAGAISLGRLYLAEKFGPGLANGHWNHHAVYWLGPLFGGVLAGLICDRFLIKESK